MRLLSSIRRAPRHGKSEPSLEPLGRPVIRGKCFSRAGKKLRIQGVTYGPFAPNAQGVQFPERHVLRHDFMSMRQSGFNAARTYIVPPPHVFELAAEQDVLLFVDIPWRKHVCFLESRDARREAHKAMRDAARIGVKHSNLLAYSIGNEIPTEIIRWHGSRKIERFLADLQDEVKQVDSDACVTYASFPPTEYLDLSLLDFVTFNVYLHRLETFRRYLLRLQNAVGDRPLLLGELGMDSLRNGEQAQADFLAGHVAELRLMGLAGSFVFSWTDDWHTGGEQIADWEFGITRRDRSPKPSCHALRLMHDCSLPRLLAQAPKVSVVVCTYNGGRTLEQCLRSLMALSYPNYEVIVVDDGSTDETRTILQRFRRVSAIHQQNQGLSVARNVGLRAAKGEIVAYTDSDCFADQDWLTHLVHQLQRTDAAAVGGPNLSPDDGRLAGCIAACPGQPTHVLESDQQAEHIPGCNMAFHRETLHQIQGFDPQFRKAGDDVDICWRLQQAGYWITFAPGAFVWHHRRQGPRAYLKQQAGYGEAEALLQYKHPERFNRRGESKWRGVLYGMGLQGVRLSRPLIYRGTFGSGMFQCLYQPGASHWAMLPTTFEWHLSAAAIAVAGMAWSPLLVVGVMMMFLSIFVSALQAYQAKIAKQHDSFASRVIVFAFSYLQPLVRSFARYRTRLLYFHPAAGAPWLTKPNAQRFSLTGAQSVDYWSETARDRLEVLQLAVEFLATHRWGRIIDSGWTDWDLRIYCHPLIYLQVKTTQENHGGNKRLIRVHQEMRLRDITIAAIGVIVLVFLLLSLTSPLIAAAALTGFCLMTATLWLRATSLAGKAAVLFDHVAEQLGMIRCDLRDVGSYSVDTSPMDAEEPFITQPTASYFPARTE
jgi:glycosyltransferase involved in cell wall biosynthesis